jgi:hypothetical protein
MTNRDETFTAVLDALYTELLAGVAQKCHASWSTQYVETRFVQCSDILPATPLIRLMKLLYPILDQIAQSVEMRHGTEDLRALTDGFRLRRVDPGSIKSDRSRAQMQALFEKLGLTDFGTQMASHLDGLIAEIAGPHVYRGIFFQMYREGDYISGHTDVHMGDRLDAQFLVSHGGTGAIRTLEEGFWQLHYDKPGAMNLVGPRMWHEVPPLMKLDLAHTNQPWRIGLCLRFLPIEAQ